MTGRNRDVPPWVAALASSTMLLLFAALSGAAATGLWELVTKEYPKGAFGARLLLTLGASAVALLVGFLGSLLVGNVVNSLRPFRRIEPIALDSSTHLVTPVSVLFPQAGAVAARAESIRSAEPDLDQETVKARSEHETKLALVKQHETDLLDAVARTRTDIDNGTPLADRLPALRREWEPVRPFGPILGAVLRSFSTVEAVTLVPSGASAAEARMLKDVFDKLFELRSEAPPEVVVDGADTGEYADYNDVKSVYDRIRAVVAAWQKGRRRTGAESLRVCVLATPGSTGAAIGAAMVTMSEPCVFEFIPQTAKAEPLRFDVVIETGAANSV